MRKKNLFLQVVLKSLMTFSCLFLGLSCQQPTPPINKSEEITLNNQAIELYIDSTCQLECLFANTKEKIPTEKVSWSSENKAIASVSNGLVKGLAEGTTQIVAKYLNQLVVCQVNVKKGYRNVQGMPILNLGASLEEIKQAEKDRGNEPYMNGIIDGDDNVTYLTVLAKDSPKNVLYDYFFENDKLTEAQWYTKLADEYWTLEDGGKPLQKVLDLVASWGFKFYGYDNSVGYPTCVSWNKIDQMLCSFGPRFRSQQTLFMFNFFKSEEPNVVAVEDDSEKIVAQTAFEKGKKVDLQIAASSEFTIDWGNGKALTYSAGNYTWENPIKGIIEGKTIKIAGGNPTMIGMMNFGLTEFSLNKVNSIEELRLPFNQLEKLELSQCKNLRFLNCSSNQLSELNLSENLELEEVHCYKNQLQELNIPSPKLELLYAYKNKITQVKISEKVKYLHCSYNQLKSIDLASFSQLIELQLGQNNLSEIKLSTAQYSHLLTLNLSSNQLATETLNKMIKALPDVTKIKVEEDEKTWKKLCKLSNNSGYQDANLQEAKNKGWIVK